MGTQTAIAEQIRKKRADYVLAVKKNQGNLYENITLYFGEEEGNYKKTVEKAHGRLEV